MNLRVFSKLLYYVNNRNLERLEAIIKFVFEEILERFYVSAQVLPFLVKSKLLSLNESIYLKATTLTGKAGLCSEEEAMHLLLCNEEFKIFWKFQVYPVPHSLNHLPLS